MCEKVRVKWQPQPVSEGQGLRRVDLGLAKVSFAHRFAKSQTLRIALWLTQNTLQKMNLQDWDRWFGESQDCKQEVEFFKM